MSIMDVPAELADLSEMLISRRKLILRLRVTFVFLAFALPVLAQQYSFRYNRPEAGLTNLAVKVLFQDRGAFCGPEAKAGCSDSRVSGFSVTGLRKVCLARSS